MKYFGQGGVRYEDGGAGLCGEGGFMSSAMLQMSTLSSRSPCGPRTSGEHLEDRRLRGAWCGGRTAAGGMGLRAGGALSRRGSAAAHISVAPARHRHGDSTSIKFATFTWHDETPGSVAPQRVEAVAVSFFTPVTVGFRL